MGGESACREGLGRSRGGLSTKVHLAADIRCRPVATLTTPGQRHDSLVLEAVLGKVRIPRVGRGRPRRRPDRVLADKAYSARRIRDHLRRRGIKATIPQPADQIGHRAAKGARGGRPPAFDPKIYQDRNTVERCVNKLRNTRAVATRYDKREYIYQGTIDVASIKIWLREPRPTQFTGHALASMFREFGWSVVAWWLLAVGGSGRGGAPALRSPVLRFWSCGSRVLSSGDVKRGPAGVDELVPGPVPGES